MAVDDSLWPHWQECICSVTATTAVFHRGGTAEKQQFSFRVFQICSREFIIIEPFVKNDDFRSKSRHAKNFYRRHIIDIPRIKI
jgi:hypothetical protein